MTPHRHSRHPTELKIRLAESYLNGEGSLKGIAKTHDISHNLLMIWVDKYRRGELSDEVDFVEKQRTYEARAEASLRLSRGRHYYSSASCGAGAAVTTP